jgi:hypothetical protein
MKRIAIALAVLASTYLLAWWVEMKAERNLRLYQVRPELHDEYEFRGAVQVRGVFHWVRIISLGAFGTVVACIVLRKAPSWLRAVRREPVGLGLPQVAQVTDSQRSRDSGANTPSVRRSACYSCGAEASYEFAVTKKPVCVKCWSAVGVCQRCGRKFGSDEALTRIGDYKVCRSCDRDLDPEIEGGFRTRTYVRDAPHAEAPNARAGDCCELCHRDYSGKQAWGRECHNCESQLPNPKDYPILARFCYACGVSVCPRCGSRLIASIL